MQSGPEHIEFYFGSQVVGYFEDQPPLRLPGNIASCLFRGPGHLCLVRELARKGPQYCHYVANGETLYFTVARIPSLHVLEVSELLRPPVSRILEST